MAKLALDFGQFRRELQQEVPAPPITGEGIVSQEVTTPQQFYFNLIYYAIFAFGVIAVIVLVFAGIKYITAGADEEKVASAKRTILGAVIGLIIIASSLVVYNFVIGRLGG